MSGQNLPWKYNRFIFHQPITLKLGVGHHSCYESETSMENTTVAQSVVDLIQTICISDKASIQDIWHRQHDSETDKH